MTTLIWLRDDLRLADHPALTAACSAAHGPVVALWIHETRRTDEDNNRHGPRPLGAATRWWYHRSLQQLAPRLADLGIPLVFARGDAADVMRRVVDTLQPSVVHWTRRYAPAACRLDAAIKQELKSRTDVHSHPGSLLAEPWLMQTANGSHYQVFTPFSHAVADLPLGPLLPEPSPVIDPDGAATALASLQQDGVLQDLEDIGLLDDGPAWWEETLAQHWEPGELAALQQLDAIDSWLPGYVTRRDLPGEVTSTSRISPRLRCGELSPRQAVAAARSSTASGFRGIPLRSRRRPGAGLATGPHRHRPRRRWNAATMADRLDAQPGTHGRGIAVHQEHAPAMARRRAVVLGDSRGRRRGQQSCLLAVGGRLRRRRCALLPHLQP